MFFLIAIFAGVFMELLIQLFVVILVFQIFMFSVFNLFAVIFSKRPRKRIKSHTKTSLLKIALVIPCYNEEAVIEKKLENSFASFPLSNQFNVYVIDDGSTDNTFKIAENYRIVHNLKNLFVYKNPGEKGKARALNWIFGKLAENIVVITDADGFLERDSITELLKDFEDPRVGGVTGKIIIHKQGGFTEKEEGLYRKIFDLWRKAESNLDSCSIFNGPLMAFRQELLNQIKIDENTYTDDIDLAYKVRLKGYLAVYEPNARVHESLNGSILMRMKQEIRRARGLTGVVLNNIKVLGHFGYFGGVIYPFSFYNYIVSPILTVFLIFVLPFVVIKYPLVLVLFLLMIVPRIRLSIFGYLYREIALVIGLVTRQKGRWTPIQRNDSH